MHAESVWTEKAIVSWIRLTAVIFRNVNGLCICSFFVHHERFLDGWNFFNQHHTNLIKIKVSLCLIFYILLVYTGTGGTHVKLPHTARQLTS